jgi:4-oxalocrotonate tautomerase
MPILNIKVSAKPSPDLTRSISTALTELTSRVLRKDPRLIAIAIDFVPPEHWVVAGRTLVEQAKKSFYFDVKVTDGTNTKDEKALFVAEAFAAFGRILGDLHPESYIYVQDVRAEAYGYGGLTQEYRYIKSQPSQAPSVKAAA